MRCLDHEPLTVLAQEWRRVGARRAGTSRFESEADAIAFERRLLREYHPHGYGTTATRVGATVTWAVGHCD